MSALWRKAIKLEAGHSIERKLMPATQSPSICFYTLCYLNLFYHITSLLVLGFQRSFPIPIQFVSESCYGQTDIDRHTHRETRRWTLYSRDSRWCNYFSSGPNYGFLTPFSQCQTTDTGAYLGSKKDGPAHPVPSVSLPSHPLPSISFLCSFPQK